ncbi:MAG: hypothetical protein A3F67_09855 [Verrucomicrobia bacterium RIFCSPHIGHO2_12_FULL_41_10]|nr:MAG: hypothetical protein A3F67_09855 [Verrucomicrobia bacterium RIFCSPHIGHO2_12_FULL_41_10]
MSGQVPIIDVALNYNLLWFYPIVWLFKLFGPSYTLLRIFFFTLATITSMLSFSIVWMTTRRTWLALLTGILVLILPGQLFRNYMAFIVVLNMTTFLKAAIPPCQTEKRRLLWMTAAGLSLGLAFLVRIDLGFFLSIILLGLILIYPAAAAFPTSPLSPPTTIRSVGRITTLRKRLLKSLTFLVLVVAGVMALHLPVYYDAVKRGFAPQFLEQYKQWPKMISCQGITLLNHALKESSSLLPLNHLITPSIENSKESTPQQSSSNSACSISSLFSSSIFHLPSSTAVEASPTSHLPPPTSLWLPSSISYLPSPAATAASPAAVGVSSVAAATPTAYSVQPITSIRPVGQSVTPPPKKTTLARRSFISSDIRERMMALNLYLPIPCSLLLALLALIFLVIGSQSKQRGLILLTCLGTSLTLFPQYFFWRPDMVHLSEFMVPMTITLLIASTFALELWLCTGNLLRIFLSIFLLFAGAELLLYYINGCQSQSTGGIAISQGRNLEFKAANGVHVKLAPHELEEVQAIYQSVVTHSQPGEYVVCYPYNPEINFMTDRPSYRRDLYIDDITAPKNFNQAAIKEIETYHPAVIVITDWPINGTEQSRFSQWAAETYHYIQNHYTADYQKGIIHVFVRPDK